MADDKLDAVIVGGGLAGLAAAYCLSDAGRQVLLLERGDEPGSKNVTGGRIYLAPIRSSPARDSSMTRLSSGTS